MNVPMNITGKREKQGEDRKPAEIPSLVSLTSQWIRDHLHLAYVSNIVAQVPDELLEVLLDGCTPDQLAKIETHSKRDLSLVTEEIWRTHCRRFLNIKDLTDLGPHSSWKSYYQQLMVQYEKKKEQTGKHLRNLYDEQAKERASKKIKVLESAPVARSRSVSSFGTTFTGYNKAVSKPMEKCLKAAKKNQVSMQWRKPQPPSKPVSTVISKPMTNSTIPRPTTKPLPQIAHSSSTFPPKSASSPSFYRMPLSSTTLKPTNAMKTQSTTFPKPSPSLPAKTQPPTSKPMQPNVSKNLLSHSSTKIAHSQTYNPSHHSALKTPTSLHTKQLAKKV